MSKIEEEILSRIIPNGDAAAYFGSRARGDEKEHSDYDVILISNRKSEGDFYFSPINDVQSAKNRVCIFYRTIDQAKKSIHMVDEDWPVRNAPFAYNRTLYDLNGLFKDLKKEFSFIPDEAFIASYHETMYHAFEYLGKIKNNTSPNRTLESARRFADKLCRATALQNHHVFKDYCNVIEETKALPHVPANILKNIEGIAGYKSWTIKQIQKASIEIWEEYLEYSKQYATPSRSEAKPDIRKLNRETDHSFEYILEDPTPKDFYKNYNERTSDMKFVFVVGSPRSGTTMLGKALGASPSAVSIEETLFHLQMWRIFWDIHQGENRRKFIPLAEKMSNDEMLDSIGNFSDSIYSSLADKNASKTIVEHTPWYGAIIPYLYKLYPESHFVHIKRNKGDVTSSLKKSYEKGFLWAGPDDATRDFIYERMVTLSTELGSSLPESDHYHEVEYEDLCKSPETVMQKLCQQLSLEYSDQVLEILSKPHASPNKENFTPAFKSKNTGQQP